MSYMMYVYYLSFSFYNQQVYSNDSKLFFLELLWIVPPLVDTKAGSHSVVHNRCFLTFFFPILLQKIQLKDKIIFLGEHYDFEN